MLGRDQDAETGALPLTVRHGAPDPRSRLVLNTTTVGYRAVLALAGPVNAFTVDGLERALERVVSSSARDVWIDLTDVTFLHAGAAAVLTDAAARLELRNRRLAVIAPPGPARTRLRLTGADRRLEVCANRVEAHRAG